MCAFRKILFLRLCPFMNKGTGSVFMFGNRSLPYRQYSWSSLFSFVTPFLSKVLAASLLSFPLCLFISTYYLTTTQFPHYRILLRARA
ncbi:hypothetical protein BDY21DRAFT_108146 [Lineolata rhizophorae]|uniref:Uncharacterized protein n=1 Tax=Lineolata rhizophorae TaxID=578093 RepID=A0A6A6NSM5_9PEZI|nr:hypothetical protein BDY21DRAFT_108146 [Lineolata rhizophorae]